MNFKCLIAILFWSSLTLSANVVKPVSAPVRSTATPALAPASSGLVSSNEQFPNPKVTVDVSEFPNRLTSLAEARKASLKMCVAYAGAYIKEYANKYKISEEATPLKGYCFRYDRATAALNDIRKVIMKPEDFKGFLDETARNYEKNGGLTRTIRNTEDYNKLMDTASKVQSLANSNQELQKKVDDLNRVVKSLEERSSKREGLESKKSVSLFEKIGIEGSTKNILLELMILFSVICSIIFLVESKKSRMQ